MRVVDVPINKIYIPSAKRKTLDEEKVMPLAEDIFCLLYTSPSPRDATLSRMPSSA